MSPIATSEIPSAAANSSGMSETDTCGRDGAGNPCGSDADDGHAVRREVEQDREGDRGDDGDEDARRPRRDAQEPQDDAEAEQADAERPGIGLVEVLDEGRRLGDQSAGVGAEPEQLGQLADEDHDRETRQVPGPDRVREEVGDEAELGQAGADGDQPDEDREHPGEGDRLLLVAGGERQDRRGDHGSERGVRAEHEDGRRSDEGVRDQADDRRVQPRDRRQARELRVGHPLRNEQRDEDDPGDEVAWQPRPFVGAEHAHAGHPAFDLPAPRARRSLLNHPSMMTRADARTRTDAARRVGTGRCRPLGCDRTVWPNLDE